MDVSWWSVAFGAFGIALIKLVWEAIKFFIKRRDKKDDDAKKFKKKQVRIEELYSDLMSGAVEIQELINAYAVGCNVARILILKMENGGGMPQLGTLQHITVLYESIHPYHITNDTTIKPVKQDFQNYTIDSEYQRMMLTAMSNDILITTTGDLDAGIVKTVYESSGILKSIILPVTHLPELGVDDFKGFLVYMSIQFTDDRDIDATIEMNYAILKEKISQIFQEFYTKHDNG